MSIYTVSNKDGVVGVGTSAKKVCALALAAVGKKDDLTGDKFEEQFPEMKRELNSKNSIVIKGSSGKMVKVEFFPTGNRHADDVLNDRYHLKAVRSGKSFRPVAHKIKKTSTKSGKKLAS